MKSPEQHVAVGAFEFRSSCLLQGKALLGEPGQALFLAEEDLLNERTVCSVLLKKNAVLECFHCLRQIGEEDRVLNFEGDREHVSRQ